MTTENTAEQMAKPDQEALPSESREWERLFARGDIGDGEAQRLSHAGSFSWRLSPEAITWSEETHRIYEYGPEIVPTMEMARQRVHPDDLALFAATALRAKQEEKDFEFEHRLLMPGGTVKHLRVVARAARSRSGKLLGFLGAVMDETAQRLAQSALENALEEVQAVRDQFQLAIDTIPGLVWSALPDGYIDFVNQRWREYTGLSLEQAGGWGWRVAIHPEDLAGLETHWRSVLASGGPSEKEARLRRFDGVYRWFLFRAVPLHDAAGGLIKWYGQTTDIDDRKQAEQQVRRSEAYLAEAQTLSRTGSFGWNVVTGELFWSAETYCILGYEPTVKPALELVFDRIHPEDLVAVKNTVDRASQDGTSLDFEHRLLMPDGAVKHVHVVAGPAKSVSGKLEFVGAIMDITERKRAAEALHASEHLARGQLDVLTHTLNALAQEADPDKLLEHVMRAVIEQSSAHSVSLWERNDENATFDLIAVIEGGFQSRGDAAHPASRLPLLSQAHPVWSEVIRTGMHAVLEDLNLKSARMRVGPDPNAPWLNVMDDADPDPGMALMKKHLAGLGVRSVLAVPMLLAGRVAGFVGVRFEQQRRAFREEEIELTRALAHQAMLAIQLMRLSRQSRQAAVMAERNRVARDIHDTLAQGFTGVIVQLEAAADAGARGLAKEAEAHVERAADLARESLQEARRSVFALRPHALEHSDLCKALEALIRKMTDGTATLAKFHVVGEPRQLPGDWQENLLRMGQELLTNALRHARAGTIEAELAFLADKVRFEFRDDGRGFDGRARHDGFGLLGIRERVDGMGGELTIDSTPGAGTIVTIALPCVSAKIV